MYELSGTVQSVGWLSFLKGSKRGGRTFGRIERGMRIASSLLGHQAPTSQSMATQKKKMPLFFFTLC
jgi:hypothetical protein